ncbi:MAG: autotransporter outer membrane beta-barrel domain-containing protein [Desulfobacteraceae bacterium]|nr:autotransporter outer membrane beta-barrel domain-containing protein [Desulfobacteraceae bacterium]
MQDSSIFNSGSIEAATNVDGTQGDATGSATGISAIHAEDSNIENSGSINSNAILHNIGGSAIVEASGIHIGPRLRSRPAETLIDSSIVNTGSINVNADLANIVGDAMVFATGISVDRAESNVKTTRIDNQGTIDVSMTTDNSASRTDFVAGGIIVAESGENKIQVKNSGMIKLDVSDLGDFEETVNPEGGQIASAVLFASTAADFSNTGRLYTSGNARALSLYEGSDVTLQNGFGYAFAGNPAEVKRPVFVDGTSTLDLNNVPLIADGASDTVLGRPYYVVDENSTVENTWGALENGFANQDITVNWYGNDRAENSAVIFNLAPRGNKSARAGMAARTAAYASQSQLSQYLLSGHVFGGEGFLADAQKNNEPILLASAGISDVLSLGASGTTYKNGTYILPYYTGTHDSGLGADITSKGLFLGYERNLDAVTAGVFGGYGNNAVRLTDTYKGNHEDQDGYTAGVYGIYNQKKWFGALYASYNEIEHDYSGWTGMNYDLRETDEYDSRVFLTEAKAGMKFEDSQWGLYPSMGLTWTNWRTESHTSTVAANPDWNTRYDSLSEDWFQLFAGVDTSRTWSLEDDQKFSLTGGAGIKQALNDNDMTVAQSLMGQSALVEESTASTSAVLNLAGIYAREAFRVKLGVISQHNEDYDSYTGYLQAGFMW